MKNIYDAILVDDDIWTRERWANKFESCGKTLALYATPNSFIKSLKTHAKDVPIFIDYRFRNLHRNGSEIAAIALKRGFTKLFITSNLLKSEMTVPEFISDVTDKEPPQWLVANEKNHYPLTLNQKHQLINDMDESQRERFKVRMSQLYDIKFGSQCALTGLANEMSEALLTKWENAIYLSVSEDELIQITQGG